MKKNQNTENKLLSGALSLTISALIVKFLGLIYKVPLSYILSDEGMGYFNSAYTVYTFFYIICTAGIPKAISILTSEAESEGNSERVNLIYRTAFNMFFIFGIITTVLFILLASPISHAIGNRGAFLTILAISPSIMFVCASGVIRGYFNGRLNLLPIAISEVISGASRLLLGLLFAWFGSLFNYDLAELSALTILGTTLGSFFGFIYLLIYKKIEKNAFNNEQNLKERKISKKILCEIFKIAIPITLTSAIGSISNVIDLGIIMKRLLSAGYTELQASILYGNYTTLAIPMLNLVATLIAPASAILLPIVSNSSVKNNKKLLGGKLSTTSKIICFVSIPISFLFMFRAKEILSIIFEDSSAVMSAPLLQLLAPGIIVMSFLTIINTVLEGLGKTNIPLIALSIGIVVKIIVSYILIGVGDFGVMGAPIGTISSYLVSFLISAYYLCVKLKIKIEILPHFLPVTLASVCSIIILNCIRMFFVKENVVFYLFELTLFSILYLIFLFIFKFFTYKNILNLAKYTKKEY